MVETRDREVVYTTESDAGPSTAIAIMFSLLIVAVLGFMVYYFSNNNLNSSPTIIQRDTNTTTSIPVPVPTPSTPAPNINITPPSTPAPAPDAGSGTTP